MMTVFFFARLWRRADVMTDIDFSEIRYSGRPAAFLRGFRALYFGHPINCIILGWVNLAMDDILMLILGVKRLWPSCLHGDDRALHAISGLWAVLWTDLLQFVMKMSMVIVLAVFAVRAVGGMSELTARLAPPMSRQVLSRWPLSLTRHRDAPDDHVLRLYFAELVGHLVSRRRARRRRLYRAANVLRQGRKKFSLSYVVV